MLAESVNKTNEDKLMNERPDPTEEMQKHLFLTGSEEWPIQHVVNAIINCALQLNSLPPSAEKTMAMRKLIEANDCVKRCPSDAQDNPS